MAIRTACLGLAAAAGLILGGFLACGGGGSTAQLASSIQVTLSPTQASVVAGATVSLQATVSGTTNTALTWAVDGIANGNSTTGTLSASGTTAVYTAPSTAGSHTVTATSVADTGRSASAAVTVTAAPAAVAVTLSPAGPLGLSASATQAFTATVTGSTNTSVTWSVDGVAGGNATTGILTGSGTSVTYTAPAAAGDHVVTATSAADTSRSASATIHVAAPTAVSVSLSPGGTVNLVYGGTQTFTATVSGSTNTAVAWTIDGLATGTSTTGTLAVSGTSVTYTAPAAAGSHTLTATSAADSSAKASATLVVAAAPVVAISLSPAGPVSLTTAGTQVFTATVTGSTNTSVGWLVDGISNGSSAVGTLVGTGATATYTAPATAGTHVVTAVAAADTSKTAAATVVVTVPVIGVTLSPSSTTTVNTSGTVSFTATVSGTSTQTVTWTVDGTQGGNATVGTITGSGLSVVYTAPSSTGTHTVTATSAADTSKSASTTVTVQAPPAVAVTLSVAGPGNIVPSGTLLITSSVTGTTNTAVTWSVDGVAGGNASTGTLFVPPAGHTVAYTAPGSTGSHVVTATSAADGTQSASLTIPVTATLVQASNIPVGANVKSSPYNAKGDGTTDDTAAIYAAVKAVAGTGKAVFIPAGTYLVDPTANQNGGIRLGSNMTLLLDPQAVLQAKSTSTPYYDIVSVTSCSNVNISGGTFIGNNLNNTITASTQAGDCIHIVASQNVVVEGLVTQNAFNDGVYIGLNCSNITVCNVSSLANRRQGMSITYANRVAVLNCTFTGTAGTSAPTLNGSGIDVEANSGESIDTLLVAGSRFTNFSNAALSWGILTASNTSTSNVFVIGNTASGNITGLNGEVSTNNWVLNNTITNNTSFGIYIHDGMKSTLVQGNTVTGTGSSGDGAGIECYNDTGTTVNANTSTGNAKYGVLVVQSTSPTITNNVLTGNGSVGLRVTNSTGVTQSGNTQ